MTKAEQIKKLMEENKEQAQRIILLESVIRDFHNKMLNLLNMYKVRDRTELEIRNTILQDKFRKSLPDDDL